MNPITIAMQGLRCLKENDVNATDEPYVLVTAADLKSGLNVETTLYGPFFGVDKDNPPKDVATTVPLGIGDEFFGPQNLNRRPFWWLDNKTGKELASADDAIFVVSMLEHDDGSATGSRQFAKAAATASLAASLGMSRPVRVQKLIADINDVLAGVTSVPDLGVLSPDDRIGGSQELRLTTAQLEQASQVGTVEPTLTFEGKGKYRVRFEGLPVRFPGLTTNAAPAGVSLGNRLHIFAKGLGGTRNNKMFFDSANLGEGFEGWVEVPGNRLTDAAPATATLGDHLFVFYKGTDNKIYINSAPNGKGFESAVWSEVQGNGRTDRAPAAAALGNRLYCVAKGIQDKQVYVNSAAFGFAFDGFGFGWSAIPGVTTNFAPAAASMGGRLYVFVTGPGGVVQHNSAPDSQPFDGFGGGGPGGWAPLTGTTTTVAPAAVGLNNHIYVFAQGANGRIHINSAQHGNSFTGWQEVQGGFTTTKLGIGAAAIGNRVYILAIGSDQRVWVNSAPEFQPFDGFGGGWAPL